jgi:hypothetical protein
MGERRGDIRSNLNPGIYPWRASQVWSKLTAFGRNLALFPAATAMLHATSGLTAVQGPMVALAGGIWDRGVDHFPYLYEKLSRRDGFQQ